MVTTFVWTITRTTRRRTVRTGTTSSATLAGTIGPARTIRPTGSAWRTGRSKLIFGQLAIVVLVELFQGLARFGNLIGRQLAIAINVDDEHDLVRRTWGRPRGTTVATWPTSTSWRPIGGLRCTDRNTSHDQSGHYQAFE